MVRTLAHPFSGGTFLKKLVAVLAALLVVMLVATFGLTVLAIDLSKETQIQGQAMKTVAGESVLVGSSDFAVAGGELVDRDDGSVAAAPANAACRRRTGAKGGRQGAGGRGI